MPVKTISIHQPGYLPWLGFFHKMICSDEFVIFDDVQFGKNSFDNRNKIKTPNGPIWLTVPIITAGKSKETMINTAQIDNRQPWRKKHSDTIKLNYSKSKYYGRHIDFFNDLYSRDWEILADLNLHIIKWVMEELCIKTKIHLSSKLVKEGKKSDLVKNICIGLNANIYISGAQGVNYLDVGDFGKNHMHIYFQKYEHPKYDQTAGEFLPFMSIIDLMFNCGETSRDVIMQNNISKEEIIREFSL